MRVEMTPELQRRIAAIARQTGVSESEVITGALEHGHSIEWQERFVEKVANGVSAADRGEFATPNDIVRVRQRYRPT